MCVILVCNQGVAPSREVLEACAEKNNHGAGIAWRDGDVIRWEKGVNMRVADVMARMKTIKFPYIIHFRISSVGLVCNELCHPFPLGGLDTRKEGSSKYGVMFHNGTWHSWKNRLEEWSDRTNHRIPDGRLSDSRAMAILAGSRGSSWLTTLDEKIAFLTPTQVEIVGTVAQWTRRNSQGGTVADAEPGIWFSNDHWEKKVTTTGNHVSAEPVVSSFNTSRSAYGRGVKVPDPSRKPQDCDHHGAYQWIDSKRFCVACGIRLEPVADKPWTNPATTAIVGDPVPDHVGNIAKRVHRLVGMGTTGNPHMH